MRSSPAHVTRQISNSTLATSPPSTPSDFVHAAAAFNSDASASDTSLSQAHVPNPIAIRLDASLITGNRDAKLEEHQARLQLSRWNARRAEFGICAASAQPDGLWPTLLDSPPRRDCSAPQSFNSTPTIGSSSNFDSDVGRSPRLAASSSLDAAYHTPAQAATIPAQSDTLHATATCPRRAARSHHVVRPTPARFYTTPGASESFNSLASISPPSSAELVTTADDQASVMQWGTQAEALPSHQPSASCSLSSVDVSPLSSPIPPSAPSASSCASAWIACSPTRPRSRTVTAADVVRSRTARDDPPPMPDAVTSPVRTWCLPRAHARKMAAESSQRRTVPADLLELLKASPQDDEIGRGKLSSDGSVRGGLAQVDSTWSTSGMSAVAGMGESRDGYIAGIRLDSMSHGFKDTSHPLSSRFAVLSSANGCELEEWKTVAASQIRPYELLELQWTIPTERVHIAPMSLHDTIRVCARSKRGGKGKLKPGWGDDTDAGSDADAPCLEPYFEGWVYVLKGGAGTGKTDKTGKGSSKQAKWKLHWITIKGWRMDVYRKKPRTGEAMLPVAEQMWPLRTIDWVVDKHNPIPPNAALAALETMPTSSLTIAFPPRGTSGSASGSMLCSSSASTSGFGNASEWSTLTLRCISRFDHEALWTLLVRAWYRSSATSAGVDGWRRKAVFRAMVAGRGGTVAAGRAGGAGRGRGGGGGRGGRGGRNAMSRTRLRPSGWPKEWEDADEWSSSSEREQIAPPPELERWAQQRRDTMTQLRADNTLQRKKREMEKVMVPNGLYAALLGRTTGTSSMCSMCAAPDTRGGTSAQTSAQTSAGSTNSSRNVSREASPLASGSGTNTGGGSAGFVDVAPPPWVEAAVDWT